MKIENVIGQTNAVEFCQIAINSAKKGGIIPSAAFDAIAGLGKTHLMQAFSQGLKDTMELDEHQFMFLASPDIVKYQESEEFQKLKMMISSGLPYILVIDEVHELAATNATVALKKIYAFIRAALDTTRKHDIQFDADTICRFDKKEHVIICGSNFLHKMGDAFTTRFSRIVLEEYTESQIIQILKMKADSLNIQINETAMIRAARAGRGNVRFLDRLMEQLEMRSIENTEVSEELMLACLKTIGLFPRGLTAHEVKMMQYLSLTKRGEDYKHKQLSIVLNIAGKEFSAYVAYLASPYNGFVKVIGDALQLTKRGKMYLDTIKQYGFISDEV